MTSYTITGAGHLPDDTTPLVGTWYISLASGYALDAGTGFRAGEQTIVSSQGDGSASATLPGTTGDEVYLAYFQSRNRAVLLPTKGAFTFTLTANTTWDAIMDAPTTPPLTPSLVSQAQAAATSAASSATAAAASAATAHDISNIDTSDGVVDALLNDSGSASRGTLNATIADQVPPLLDTQVPPLVAASLAADNTPAVAAADAVGNALGGVAAIYRTNLAINPTPKLADTGWVNWAGTGGASTKFRTQGGDGVWRYGQTWTTATTTPSGDAGFGSATVDDIVVSPGTVVTATMDVTPSVTQRLRLRIEFYDTSGTLLSTVYGIQSVVSAGVETTLALVTQVPASSARALVRAGVINGTGAQNWPVGGTLAVTHLLVEVGTQGDYFDGDTSAVTKWLGTQGASQSQIMEFNLLNYVGEKTSDGINAALAAGNSVLLDEGTYLVSSPILLHSNTAIVGRGSATILQLMDGANCHVIDTTDYAAGADQVLIADLTIDGNRDNQTPAVMDGTPDENIGNCGLSAIRIDHLHLRNVTAQNCNGHGLYITGRNPNDYTTVESSPIWLYGCYTHHNTGWGTFVSATVRKVTYSGLRTEYNNVGGVQLDHSEALVDSISAAFNLGDGIFIRNVIGCHLTKLHSLQNKGYGIYVSTLTDSTCSDWVAVTNCRDMTIAKGYRTTDQTTAEVYFADDTFSYGVSHNFSVSGINVIGNKYQYGSGTIDQRHADYGVYVADGINQDVVLERIQYGDGGLVGDIRLPADLGTMVVEDFPAGKGVRRMLAGALGLANVPTTGLPDPAIVGAGVILYDSTRQRWVGSNGAAWVGLDGTAL